MLKFYVLSDTNQLEEIRRMTGVCPQHDVLFDQLTPREHLEFFAKIRASFKYYTLTLVAY